MRCFERGEAVYGLMKLRLQKDATVSLGSILQLSPLSGTFYPFFCLSGFDIDVIAVRCA